LSDINIGVDIPGRDETPQIGIFWRVQTSDGRPILLVDCVPMAKAETYGEFLTHGAHYERWSQLAAMNERLVIKASGMSCVGPNMKNGRAGGLCSINRAADLLFTPTGNCKPRRSSRTSCVGFHFRPIAPTSVAMPIMSAFDSHGSRAIFIRLKAVAGQRRQTDRLPGWPKIEAVWRSSCPFQASSKGRLRQPWPNPH
jgi:hypothetical protein